jgi:hypothetical protein
VPRLPRQPRRRHRRLALLHGVRPAPAPRHGVPPLLRGGRAGRPHRAVRRRPPEPRLHLRRRRRHRDPRRRHERRRRGPRLQHRRRLAGERQRRARGAGRDRRRPLDVRRSSPEAGDVSHTAADGSRAREELGFAPATSLSEGLRAEYEWVRRRVEAEPETALRKAG